MKNLSQSVKHHVILHILAEIERGKKRLKKLQSIALVDALLVHLGQTAGTNGFNLGGSPSGEMRLGAIFTAAGIDFSFKPAGCRVRFATLTSFGEENSEEIPLVYNERDELIYPPAGPDRDLVNEYLATTEILHRRVLQCESDYLKTQGADWTRLDQSARKLRAMVELSQLSLREGINGLCVVDCHGETVTTADIRQRANAIISCQPEVRDPASLKVITLTLQPENVSLHDCFMVCNDAKNGIVDSAATRSEAHVIIHAGAATLYITAGQDASPHALLRAIQEVNGLPLPADRFGTVRANELHKPFPWGAAAEELKENIARKIGR